ncbi:MAG: MATE family efflux transporter [Ruminococcaceae bacterium]|nr:MATE family efflux transporter [Oscillospiraceae bacterium]
MAPAVTKNKNVNMTEGPLWNKILIYFMPLLLTTILQRILHSMDVAVIGRFSSEADLAAVSASGSVSSLLSGLVSGLSVGSVVVVGQLIGSKKVKTAKKAIHNSILIGFAGGLIIALLGVIFTQPLLKMTYTPNEIMDKASLYLIITFLAKPFLLSAAFASAVARSKGDSKSPLLCSSLTAVTNLILNIIFVAYFKWGVFGVAIATFTAHFVNCVSILICLGKNNDEYRFTFRELKPDKYIIYRIVAIGIPTAIQSILTPLSNVFLQSSYNRLGTEAMAANAIGSTCESISFCVTAAFTLTTIAFVSQNYGAKKLDRCRKTLYITIGFSTLFTYLIDLVILIFKDYTIGFMTDNQTVLEMAFERLLYVYSAHFFLIVIDQLTSAIRGFGKTALSSVISIIGICGLRIVWSLTVFQHYKTYTSLITVYPITFIGTALAMTVAYIYTYRRLPVRNE